MKKCISFPLFILMAALFSCNDSKVESPKQELLDAFKDQKIESDFNFETSENDSLTTAAFKNKAISNQIMLTTRDTSLVIGYFSEKNKKTSSSSVHKYELIMHDSAVYIEISDATKKIIDKITYPAIIDNTGGVTPPVPDGFDSINDCIADFNCTRRGALQCQANKTCSPVGAALLCCLTNGQCFSVHLLITPNIPICSIKSSRIPDILIRR